MSKSRDARKLLRSLVGQELRTVRGFPNTILEVRNDDVIVATQRSPKGKLVEITWIQAALDTLAQEGEVEISPRSIGYRSALIGAVLRTLPRAQITADSPPRIRLPRSRE